MNKLRTSLGTHCLSFGCHLTDKLYNSVLRIANINFEKLHSLLLVRLMK
jgi:hypothetical protein